MNQFTRNQSQELLVIRPQEVAEGMQADLSVRSRKTVVLDLTSMNYALTHCTADFVSGGITAIDGQEHRLGDHVFLFTPEGIEVFLK